LQAFRGRSTDLPRFYSENGGSGGGTAFYVPVPRQQVADAFCRVIKHSCQDIGEPGLRIDVVELRGLCRPPNYAERARFPQYS
jgi:hypothetical protein